jgi:HEAT repeat protein
MISNAFTRLPSLLALLLVSVLQGAPAPSASELDALIRDASRYTIAGSREPLVRIESLINLSRPTESLRHQLELRMAAALAGDATDEAKRAFCRHLWIMGSDTSVPALERMLLTPATTHIACYALLNHPSKAADTALRRALDASEGLARIAVIQTLGNRRDVRAVGALGRLASGPDILLAESALSALGRIGGFSSADTLERIRRTATEGRATYVALALLQCAQRFSREGESAKASALYQRLFQDMGPLRVRRAALIGLISSAATTASADDLVMKAMKDSEPSLRATAIAQIPMLKDANSTRRFAGLLPGASPETQLLLIDALTDRGDLAARPALENLLQSPSLPVSIAAIRSLGRFGDAASAASLLQVVTASPDRSQVDAALGALRQLSGNTVDEVILKSLRNATAGLRPALIELLADRRATNAAAAILQETMTQDQAITRAAWKALGLLAGPAHLDAALNRLVALGNESLASDAEVAIVRITQQFRSPEPRADATVALYKKTETPAARLSLLRVLAGIGNSKALDCIVTAATDPLPAVKDTALRLISTWTDPAAIKPLLKLAGEVNETALRVVLVRGALRLLADAANLPVADRLAGFRAALGLITQPEEKRLALASLAETPFPGALELALPFLADAQVKPEACLAAVKIARAQLQTQKTAARAALEAVLAASPDPSLRDQAEALLKSSP